MVLRPTIWVGVIAAVLSLGTAYAAEPVRVISRDNVRGLEIRLVAGSFGRILDVNASDSAPVETELKFFIDGEDVTTAVRRRPPLIEIAYVFAGVSAARQCSFKVQLDAALSSISEFNLGYSDIENALCPEFGLRPLQAWHEDFVAPGDYSRLLVIEVAGESEASVPPARLNAWAQLTVPASLFENKARLVSQITGFVDANIFGGWSIVPTDVAPADAPLTVTFADANGVFFTLNAGTQTAPGVMSQVGQLLSAVASRNLWLTLLLPALLGIGLAIVVIRTISRNGGASREEEEVEPLRAIAVGYGADRKYSLGEGTERDVALVMLYPNGRMRIVRKSEGEPILVNGAAIDRDAWITAADRVIIGAKQFQFN